MHWSAVIGEEGGPTIKPSSAIDRLLRSVTMKMFGVVVAVAVFLETVSATSVCMTPLKCFFHYLIKGIRH